MKKMLLVLLFVFAMPQFVAALDAPTLNDLGPKQKKTKPYVVSWSQVLPPVGVNVLRYVLEEARNDTFTNKLVSRTIIDEDVALSHNELIDPTTFYYRVKAQAYADDGRTLLEESAYSNVDKKRLTVYFPIKHPNAYYNALVPFDQKPSDVIIDDLNSNNDKGTIKFHGPGWVGYSGAYAYKYFYHYVTRASEDGSEKATWRPNSLKSGRYRVWVSFFTSTNRGDAAYYYVVSAEGSDQWIVDQNHPWPLVGSYPEIPNLRWAMLGTYNFIKGLDAYVQLRNNPTPYYSECADAVAFEYIGPIE